MLRRPAFFCFGRSCGLGVFVRELVCDGEAEEQHDADDLHRGERIAEKYMQYVRPVCTRPTMSRFTHPVVDITPG